MKNLHISTNCAVQLNIHVQNDEGMKCHVLQHDGSRNIMLSEKASHNKKKKMYNFSRIKCLD